MTAGERYSSANSLQLLSVSEHNASSFVRKTCERKIHAHHPRRTRNAQNDSRDLLYKRISSCTGVRQFPLVQVFLRPRIKSACYDKNAFTVMHFVFQLLALRSTLV